MSKRLLLADDSITIQKVIGITFANEDYQLDIVDNGDAALEKAQTERPDMILADVYMPGKNGYELCQAVKQNAGLQGVPVLLLTGTFEPFDEDKARQAGADDWISKPFESQSLIDKVEELLAAAAAAPPAPVVAEEPMTEEVAEVVEPEVAFDSFAAPAAEVAPVPEEETPEVSPFDEVSDEEPITELAEEDIWVEEGDLQLEEESFDLVEAVEEPGGEDSFAAPVEEAASEAVEEDIWGAVSFDEDELLAPAVSEEAPVAEEDSLVPSASEESPVSEDELLAPSVSEETPAVETDFSQPFPGEVESAGEELSQPEFGAEPAEDSADIWADTEEEIFDLDDIDIIEEDDLLVDEEAVAASVEPVSEVADPFATPADDSWADEVAEPAEAQVEVEAAELEPGDDVIEPGVADAGPADEFFAEATVAPAATDFSTLENLGAEDQAADAAEEPMPGDDVVSADVAVPVEEEPVAIEEEPVAIEEEPAVVEEEPAVVEEEWTTVEEAEPEVVETVEVVEQRVAALSEEELAAIVERVAGAVVEKLAAAILEKVAWEVVPDLAENLIKEEIRKIKTAV